MGKHGISTAASTTSKTNTPQLAGIGQISSGSALSGSFC
jgi:hypothetical protein